MSRPVNRMRPVHPGEVLREDYLMPLEMSVNALALALAVPATRIHEIVKERRGITADTAERLAHYFGGDAASWLALQADYDLKTLPTRAEIERRVHPRSELVDV
jgi:addiction module HigA family antidote